MKSPDLLSLVLCGALTCPAALAQLTEKVRPQSAGSVVSIKGTCLFRNNDKPPWLEVKENQALLPGQRIVCREDSATTISLPRSENKIEIKNDGYIIPFTPSIRGLPDKNRGGLEASVEGQESTAAAEILNREKL